MAIDTQTIVMTGSYLPYERPPQPVTLWSAIPRGLQSFIVPTAGLDAKALNDSMILALTATLPPNFGYVLADLMVTIAQDEALDWNNRFIFNLQNFYRAPINDSVALSATWVDSFDGQAEGLLRAGRGNNPTYPIIGTPGTSGALARITMTNPTADATTAGTINAALSFWQFDLEQIRKYPINSPTPTHSR